MNNMENPVVYIDEEKTIIYANDYFLKLTGYNHEEIKYKKIDLLLDLQNCNLQIKNNKKIPIEYNIFDIKSSYKIKSMITIRSINSEYELESLKQEEEEYKNKFIRFEQLSIKLLNLIPKAIVFLSEDGKILNYNQRFKDIFELKSDDVNDIFFIELFKKIEFFEIDKNHLFSQKSIPDIIEIISNSRFSLNGKIYSLECKNIKEKSIKDKITYNKEDSSVSNYSIENINSPEIKQEKYIVLINDITDIHMAQKYLQSNTIILNDFFKNNPIPMCFTNSDGFIGDVNISFERYFNVNRSINIFSLSKDIENAINYNYKDIINNKVVYLGDFIVNKRELKIIKKIEINKLIKKNKINENYFEPYGLSEGTMVFSIYCNSTLKTIEFNEENNLKSLVFIFIDITELTLKKLELNQNKQISKKISIRLDKLINNINHEVRTPINIISGYIELLKMENTYENFKLILEEIEKNKDFVINIINEIISISSFSLDEENSVAIKIKPLLIDYKNYIVNKCMFKDRIKIPLEDNIEIKINIIIFKKLINYIVENYKEYDFLEFFIDIKDYYSKSNKLERFIFIKMKGKTDLIDFKTRHYANLKIIILKYLTFLLNGKIDFDHLSEFNFTIKIPVS